MSESSVVWTGWPEAPAPLAAIRAARRRGTATVTDDAGRSVPFGTGTMLREIARGLWLRALDAALLAVSAMLTQRRSPPERGAATTNTGPVVLVLPVLPDLSHTFVYREVLALLRQRPDWRVIVLERNARAPVHREAEELLATAAFLPRDGITRRALRVLGWLLRPAGRELFALYRSQENGSLRDLLGKNPLRDPRHPGNAFRLADLLQPLAPRHVHVYSSTYAANVAMGAAHLLAVPWSLSSYVDFEFPYAHQLLAEKIARARFFRVVTAFCARRLRELPGLLPLSPLAPLSQERVPVVYLGLDLQNWQQQATPPGTGTLVSAARLVPKKGLHLVPAALAALRSQGIACHWRVFGDGPELDRLRTLCNEHQVTDLVDFAGARDNTTVRHALLEADAALLPCVVAADGERDGIPIFLCEAMALAVPIVTTPVSGIPELVHDGDTGFLAKAGDSQDLARVLRAVLEDTPNARRVGLRGRAAVQRELDVDHKAAELIACIEREARAR